MLHRLIIAVLALWALFVGDGVQEGRRGNALYVRGQYAEAAAAYRAGLDALEDDAGATRTHLWNNLGAALHRQEQYKEARAAFANALAAAEAPGDAARAAYNAGLSAAAADQHEAALNLFKQALLADPAYEDARFNYEFLKRRMRSREQPSQNRERIEPSAYARRLKAQADSLVARQAYRAAERLMAQGLQRDSTVRAYQDFIVRIGNVAQIDDTTRTPSP